MLNIRTENSCFPGNNLTVSSEVVQDGIFP
uniref:Uncharacterized protein n=1 Tax=Octopus bimaculoides TaxID=37653 RepID=A0A0L8I0D8_OCTBM